MPSISSTFPTPLIDLGGKIGDGWRWGVVENGWEVKRVVEGGFEFRTKKRINMEDEIFAIQ